MRKLVGVAVIVLSVIVLDWVVFGGRYELLLLTMAMDAATVVTTNVAEFFSHNLRRG
jgi:hypothetical protein